jgi:hypothetical protein
MNIIVKRFMQRRMVAGCRELINNSYRPLKVFKPHFVQGKRELGRTEKRARWYEIRNRNGVGEKIRCIRLERGEEKKIVI